MSDIQERKIESEEAKEVKKNLWDISDSQGQIEPLPEDGEVYENDIKID